MKTPDHHTSKLGSRDFIFQCHKWPFSITCNPLLPKITECYIDLSLITDMKIPIKKVECRSISYGGYETKVVGSISQTIQVIYDGVPSGTMHLKAKVIRNLTRLYNVDCVASQKLYNILTQKTISILSSVEDSPAQASLKSKDTCSEHSNESSDLILDVYDSPDTRKRKRRKRFAVSNVPFTSSLESLAPNPNHQADPHEPPQVQHKYDLNPSDLLGSPKLNHPDAVARQERPLLENLIFCGQSKPCPCLDTLRPVQLLTLPPYYPVHLQVGHQPCGQHPCGYYDVHPDNLHPPDSGLCPCNPPRLDPTLSISTLRHRHPAALGHEHPQSGSAQHPLPQDFQPCGYFCEYEDCGCLRQYSGRDWAS